jgi:hypothetical protein
MVSLSLLASKHENVRAVQDEPLYEIVNGQCAHPDRTGRIDW